MVKSCADCAAGLGIFEQMLDTKLLLVTYLPILKDCQFSLLLLVQFLFGQNAMPILQFLLGHGIGILHFSIFRHF